MKTVCNGHPSLRKWCTLGCVMATALTLAGCVTARPPELTAGERAYNKALKSQSSSAVSMDDVLLGILGGLVWTSQYALVAGGEALAAQ